MHLLRARPQLRLLEQLRSAGDELQVLLVGGNAGSRLHLDERIDGLELGPVTVSAGERAGPFGKRDRVGGSARMCAAIAALTSSCAASFGSVGAARSASASSRPSDASDW